MLPLRSKPRLGRPLFEPKLAQAKREMPSKVISKRTEYPISGTAPRRDRRPKRRAMLCPAHPDQRIDGNGRKYFLHLLSPEELQQRSMTSKQAGLHAAGEAEHVVRAEKTGFGGFDRIGLVMNRGGKKDRWSATAAQNLQLSSCRN